MKNPKTYTVAQRRKREGKTDYRKRLKLLLSGKPRLVVRASLTQLTAQIVEYAENGDKVLLTLRSSALRKHGWKYGLRNLPSAYLLGALVGKAAKEKGIKNAILDMGLSASVKGSRIYAVVKGAVDAGLRIPHGEAVMPSDDRISGKHVVAYAGSLGEKSKERFSGYHKAGADPAAMDSAFTDIKKNILGAQ